MRNLPPYQVSYLVSNSMCQLSNRVVTLVADKLKGQWLCIVYFANYIRDQRESFPDHLTTWSCRCSWSEPHTSVTALQDACVCMSVCPRTYVWPYTENFNSTNGYRYMYISNLNTCWSKALQNSKFNVQCKLTLRYLTPRQWIRQQERRRSEQTEVRQARLDRQRVCDHERRAAEQPAARQARQARLGTDRQRNRQRRAAEQPEARPSTISGLD